MVVLLFVGWIVFKVHIDTASRERHENKIRQEAIDHGCAEWRVDPKTGATEFVWLTSKGETGDE
jgi:hypothetical protein